MTAVGAPTVVAPNGTTDTKNEDGSHTLAAPGVTPASSPASFNSQALLVTSNPSRAVTSSNANKLQSLSPLGPGVYEQTPEQRAATEKATGMKPVGETTSVDGSGGNTTTTTANKGTTNADVVASIKDPALAAQYKTSLDNFDSQASQAQATISSLRAATPENDSATQALIASITAKYEQAISLMKAKNTQVLGRANNSVGAFGGLGQMSQNFLNDEQQQADARVQNLANQEQTLIMKAKAAFQTNNVKALNAAMTEYDKVNKDKLDALNKLLDETNKQVTQQQAQQKIDAAADKASLAADISKATNLGVSIAKSLADSGITDQTQIDDYVASVADEYGISNPDILKSAVIKAQQAQSKLDTAAGNTANTIKNRDARTAIAAQKKTVTGGGTFKISEGIAKVTPQMEAVKGADGYIAPEKWVAARTNWNSLGGTDASFNSNFKKYLNPASYTIAGFKAPAATGPVYKTN